MLRHLEEAKRILQGTPRTPEMESESQALAEIEDYLTIGNEMKFRKHAKFQAHQRRQSKPYP